MYSKKTAIIITFLLGSMSLCAHTFDKLDDQIKKDIKQTVVEAITETMPFEAYKKALENIKEPSYDNLRPLFENLTVFNATFNKEAMPAKNKLAKYLNQSVKAGWNSYHNVNMTEIFQHYFPQENTDKNIALLEYNIKSSLLGSSEYAEILMFRNTKDDEISKLYTAYTEFVKTVQDAKTYNTQNLAKDFVLLIKSCNQADQVVLGLTVLAKKSLFVQPILAGWGRTVTVEEIRGKLGMEADAYGDGVNFYSSDMLKDMYDLTDEEASLMAQFIKEYHIDE